MIFGLDAGIRCEVLPRRMEYTNRTHDSRRISVRRPSQKTIVRQVSFEKEPVLRRPAWPAWQVRPTRSSRGNCLFAITESLRGVGTLVPRVPSPIGSPPLDSCAGETGDSPGGVDRA